MKETPPNSFYKFKLWGACSKDEMRPVLSMVHFDNGYAYASDAHILVRIPLYILTNMEEKERNKLNGYSCDAKAFKLLTEIGTIELDDAEGLIAKGWLGNTQIAIEFSDRKITQPPKFEDVLALNEEITPIDRIGVDQSALKRLTDAIGDQRVKLGFIDKKSKIFVTPIRVELCDVLGLIMTIMTTGTIDGF